MAFKYIEKKTISFSPPDISEAEIEEVADALRSGWITTGPKVKELEKRMAKYCHTRRQVCLNSATAAEELNLRILGIQPGDEVIVPAYTYTATASAVIHCGGTVIFVDSQKDGDPTTHAPEMDYDAMEAAITERTKAIVAVDLAGLICNYDRIYQAVENKRHLFKPSNPIQEKIGRVAVVSDCAHALGASRNGKMAGEFADFSSYSYHAVKNFTTAEGGAATWTIPDIDDEKLYNQYELYSLHGQNKDALAKTKQGAWEYDIIGPWYKCNMTDIMAAIGLRQLDRYPELLERRKEIIDMYDAMCDDMGIFHLNHYGKDYAGSGHLYLVRISDIDVEQRNKIIEKLAEKGVATNVHYKPLPMMTAYKAYGWNIKDFPNAYDYYHNLITLPLHTKLSNEDVEYVIRMFEEVIGEYRRKYEYCVDRVS
jgi:dTDP-4-amino-4,6-dideoxygalactose transaminase